MKLTMKKYNIVPPKKLPLIALATCMAMVAFTQNAGAARHPMPPQPAHLLAPFQFFTQGPIGNPSDELTYLQTHGGGSYQPTFLPATSQYLGKFNRNEDNSNNIENGAINIADFVSVTFNGNEATISWDLTGSGFTLDGLLLKDGNVRGQGML